jgi:hypothetical protein
MSLPNKFVFLLTTSLSLPDNQGKLFDHYISVLAATMSDSEEPLESTSRDETSEFAEPLPSPLATGPAGGNGHVLIQLIVDARQYKRDLFDHIISVLAATMSGHEEPELPLSGSLSLIDNKRKPVDQFFVCHNE